ncbi:RluA family pseudouridine synthase [Lachnospira multipara]|uniref:RNA pseudouridylate synthase n=1 Tax=Lachnospira multipara TaxID=28051 RepID=A0A1H5WUP6_9FIRM|nr:RNA pseudouridine synthase [Lachnospira multipara]SEG02970.1 ribosomal large subunit pseudouridine synthase D [Lachnospira multipara]
MLKIIYEDNEKLIVDKKAGQLSQSGKGMDLDLMSEVLTYRKRKGEDVYAAIINRLDRPVAGLVLFAKTKEAAAKYSKEVQDKGSISKVYEAYVYGKFDCKKETLTDYLIHDKVNNTSSVWDGGVQNSQEVKNAKSAQNSQIPQEAKESRLEYEVLSYDEATNVSKISVKLLTGRHHQIRVQFASRGHVIIGDYKYLDMANEKLGGEAISKETFDDLSRKCRIRRNTIALAAVELELEGKKFRTELK